MGQKESHALSDKEYRADKALDHYFRAVVSQYNKRLEEGFGAEAAVLLYSRTYLHLSTLWFCRDVIRPFATWFKAVVAIKDTEEINRKWDKLEVIIDRSIDNMIAFIARIQKAHGEFDWLTARRGLTKVVDVFLTAVDDPSFDPETSFLWDIINHEESKCVSNTIAFAFVAEILGEWREVRLGLQPCHIFVAGLDNVRFSEITKPMDDLSRHCDLQESVACAAKYGVCGVDRNWGHGAMLSMEMSLAYEGQSAFIFTMDMVSVYKRVSFIGISYLKYYRIHYLENDAALVNYYDYLIHIMITKPRAWGIIIYGISLLPLEGMETQDYVNTIRYAKHGATEIVAQVLDIARMDGVYGQHPFGTEHALFLYYMDVGRFIQLGEDDMFNFQHWIGQQSDVGYLQLYAAMLFNLEDVIPVEMHAMIVEHLPFYYWNDPVILNSIAGLMFDEYNRDTIPPLLYTIPFPLAVYILAVLRGLQHQEMATEDVWAVYAHSKDIIVPTAEMIAMKKHSSVWEANRFTGPEYEAVKQNIDKLALLHTAALYRYLGQCYAQTMAGIEKQWAPSKVSMDLRKDLSMDPRPSSKGCRQNPVFFAEVHKLTFSAESVAYYAKYSLWFTHNPRRRLKLLQHVSILQNFMEDVVKNGELENEFAEILDHADLSGITKEMIQKFWNIGKDQGPADEVMAHAWHPYIYALFLSDKADSNILMLAMLLFLIKDTHPYFLEFMGETSSVYELHRSEKAKAIVLEYLQEPMASGDVTIGDVLSQK